MDSIEERIKEYYDSYDEESRLVKDYTHYIEFLTTTKYIEKYITKGSKLLEVGAGTGRYSFYFSENGYDVTALELCDKHVRIMEEKAKTHTSRLSIQQGNGLDLSQFEDNSFDAVLCFGPLYHIHNQEDRIKCIRECMRVVKPEGILAVAYISRYAVYADLVKRDKNYIHSEELNTILEKGMDNDECFYFSSFEEMDALMKGVNVKEISHIATDGIGDMIRSSVNSFSEEELEKWLLFHFATCENKHLIGYSKHCLYIGRCEKDGV